MKNNKMNRKKSPITTEEFIAPSPICQKELIITYIETPCLFWASLVSQMNKQAEIDNKLANLCDSLPKLRTPPQLGKMYASVYSVDNNWYRCKIIQIINKNQSEVLYVDYGNKEVINNNLLVTLPSNLSNLHILAYPYWLLRLKTVPNEAMVEKGIEFIENLKTKNNLKATLYSKTNDSIIPIIVHLSNGENLNDILIEKKFCNNMNDEEFRSKFIFSSSPTLKCRSKHSFGSSKSYPNQVSENFINNSVKQNSIKKLTNENPYLTNGVNYSSTSIRSKSGSPIKLIKLRPNFSNPNHSEEESSSLNLVAKETFSNTVAKDPPYCNSVSKDPPSCFHGDEENYYLEKNRKNLDERKNLLNNIDQLSIELTDSSNEILYLLLENNNLKNEIINQKNNNKDLEKHIQANGSLIEQKFKSLLLNTKNVFLLRYKINKQNELKIELDMVIEILVGLQSTNQITRKINSVQAVFNNLQNKIKSKQIQDEELQKLIAARDSARKLLSSDLECFIFKKY